jgi:hypothetical protein
MQQISAQTPRSAKNVVMQNEIRQIPFNQHEEHCAKSPCSCGGSLQMFWRTSSMADRWIGSFVVLEKKWVLHDVHFCGHPSPKQKAGEQQYPSWSKGRPPRGESKKGHSDSSSFMCGKEEEEEEEPPTPNELVRPFARIQKMMYTCIYIISKSYSQKWGYSLQSKP